MQHQHKVSRRGFFVLSGTLAVASQANSEPTPEADSGDNRSVVVTETDHIRTYYALARR
ncbi:hypothetical protein [Halovulum marinum]|uniref:hypothetical protein n=1 Tax=Halovulum marinum TaxID=2662447 RepID=UPI0012B407E0|nr:hypothetical protein [Halovulum marinum]